MGAKGDRAAKEPLAMRMYADGATLSDISRQLDVSDTSLRRWKMESAVPGDAIDGWDRARQQKRANILRLRDLFERQLEYVEGLPPCEVSPPMMDTLSKLGALTEKMGRIEAEIRKKALEDAASAVEAEEKNGGPLTADRFRKIIQEQYGV